MISLLADFSWRMFSIFFLSDLFRNTVFLSVNQFDCRLKTPFCLFSVYVILILLIWRQVRTISCTQWYSCDLIDDFNILLPLCFERKLKKKNWVNVLFPAKHLPFPLKIELPVLVVEPLLVVQKLERLLWVLTAV